jgi:hypothetical protein
MKQTVLGLVGPALVHATCKVVANGSTSENGSGATGSGGILLELPFVVVHVENYVTTDHQIRSLLSRQQ